MLIHFTQEHMSPQEVGLLARNAGVKELVLVHIGISDAALPKALAQISAIYKGKVIASKDLETF